MITQPKTYIKAIWSVAVAIVGCLGTALVGDVTPGDLTWGQWMVVLGAALAAFGGTYGLVNKAPNT